MVRLTADLDRYAAHEPSDPVNPLAKRNPRHQPAVAPQPLHRRPQHPRRELGRAEIERLAFGPLARGDAQHQLKRAFAALLDRLVAIQHGAAIDVHVILDMSIHRRIGRQLDRGRRLAAEHRTAAEQEAVIRVLLGAIRKLSDT